MSYWWDEVFVDDEMGSEVRLVPKELGPGRCRKVGQIASMILGIATKIVCSSLSTALHCPYLGTKALGRVVRRGLLPS